MEGPYMMSTLYTAVIFLLFAASVFNFVRGDEVMALLLTIYMMTWFLSFQIDRKGK